MTKTDHFRTLATSFLVLVKPAEATSPGERTKIAFAGNRVLPLFKIL